MDTGKPTLDEVIRWMEQHQAGAVVPGTSRMLRAALDYLRELQDLGRAPVTRCAACKYAECREIEGKPVLHCARLQIHVWRDFFCAWGAGDGAAETAKEPRHAYWYDIGASGAHCSRCHYRAPQQSRFCPHCGAKMERREKP